MLVVGSHLGCVVATPMEIPVNTLLFSHAHAQGRMICKCLVSRKHEVLSQTHLKYMHGRTSEAIWGRVKSICQNLKN